MKKTGFYLFYELFARSEHGYYLTEILPEAIRGAHPLFKYWDRDLTRDYNKTNDMVLLLNEVLSQDSK
jgi:hypothetical protein